jgi:hypothetical protein
VNSKKLTTGDAIEKVGPKPAIGCRLFYGTTPLKSANSED